MKVTLLSFLIAATITMSVPVWAQDNSTELAIQEEFPVLTISGVVTEKTDKMGDVLVELFEQNKLVDAMETKKNGKFKFALYNNHIYTLQFSKGGYVTKRISVNTHVPSDFEDELEYPFDCDLDKEITDASAHVDNLNEYPIAIILFDENKKAFAFDKGYTSSLKQEIKAAED